MKLTLIGRGRVGRGLTRCLRRTQPDWTIQLTPGQTPEASMIHTADVLVLTVPDPAITTVTANLPLREAQHILHCSGSLTHAVLAEHCPPGVASGVMHPLVSFADGQQPPDLCGTTFVIDGHPEACVSAATIARAVSATPIIRAIHGPAYHAAAVLSANAAAALASVAIRILEELGTPTTEAQQAIGALLRTVGENVANIGVPHALSGPIIRGNAETVTRHRKTLAELDPTSLAAYDAVAPAILDCASRAGLAPEKRNAILEALALLPGSE